MSDTTPVRFDAVHFRYGRREVLTGLDLALEPGQVTVLAAPNGEGKTTVLWLAAGLLMPENGRVAIFGRDPFRDREVLGRVGFLAEGAPLPASWTARQVLDFQRQTFPRWDEPGCQRLVDRFGIDLKQRVKQLSRGERGKLALMAVLCTRPEVLLLDEPTLGLDVATRRLLASEILSRLADDGCTVLLASHEIAEAESAADRFVLIDEGRVRCQEEVAALLERHRVLGWDEGMAAPPDGLDLLPLPDRLGKRALARRWDPATVSSWVAAGGRESPADLETIYLAMTGGAAYA